LKKSTRKAPKGGNSQRGSKKKNTVRLDLYKKSNQWARKKGIHKENSWCMLRRRNNQVRKKKNVPKKKREFGKKGWEQRDG